VADPRNSACALCGGPLEAAFTASDRNRGLGAERFHYARCTACGTLALSNPPSDLGRFYPASYYDLPDAASLPAETAKVELLERFAEPGRLVEIGPGSGAFAHTAKQAGFDVTGIEMDARTAEHLRTTVGVNAINSAEPEQVLRDLPPSRAIALWQVIEHVPNPGGVLDAAAANLEPGGALILATPNPQALQFKLMGPRWPHVDAPRHLFLLPLDALTARAQRAGLRRVFASANDADARNWNRFGWEWGFRRRPGEHPPTRAVALSTLAFTLAVSPLEQRGMLGASYTAVFTKEPA
jgi:SAM-dependent methyltransferase